MNEMQPHGRLRPDGLSAVTETRCVRHWRVSLTGKAAVLKIAGVDSPLEVRVLYPPLSQRYDICNRWSVCWDDAGCGTGKAFDGPMVETERECVERAVQLVKKPKCDLPAHFSKDLNGQLFETG